MTARLLACASTLLVTAASAATLATGPAQALPPPADPLAAAAVGTQQANESTQQIKQYWTAERMETALPMPEISKSAADAPLPPPSTRSESGDGGGPAAFAGSSAAESAAPLSTGGQSLVWADHSSTPATTIGKLYLTEDGVRHWCSAAVINSANHNTIWTAGHCVTKGNGTWNSAFLFAPDYYQGNWPYGTWAGKSWAAPQGYFKGANHNYDMAAIALDTDSYGRRAGDVVGWQGYKFGDAYKGTVWPGTRAFGYPQDTHPQRSISPVGADLRFCNDTVSPSQSIYQKMSCDMGHGSSGGPWITGMPWPSRGWGYIIGHNDFENDPTQAVELSPQLGDDAINARAAVQAD